MNVRRKSKAPGLFRKVQTKQIQRRVLATAVCTVIVFGSLFIYWNFGVNREALAGINYTWNGASDSLWSNTANWTPAGVPAANDQVTIPAAASRYPVLNGTVSVSDLNLNAGARLDMNGYSLTVLNGFTLSNSAVLNVNGASLNIGGNVSLPGGTISGSSGTGNVIINATNTTFGSSSTGPVIQVDILVSSATLSLRNTTFHGVTQLTKTGSTNDAASGNNTFNNVTTITNSGTGYMVYANSTRDIFNADVTLNSSGSGMLYLAYNGLNTQFNGHVNVNCSGAGVRIGASNGSSTLAAGKYLRTGNSGFTSGLLQLSNINFSGAEDQSFLCTGSAVVNLGPSTVFNGNVEVTSPGINFNGTTFNGTLTAVKNGSSNNTGAGNNVFQGFTSITNAGTGYMVMSNSTRDLFNSEATFSSTNSGILYVAYNGNNTQFNENVNVNSTASGSIRFGAGAGTSTLAAGKTIRVGALGFGSGSLQLGGISFPALPYSVSLGNTAVLTLGPSTSFPSNVSTVSGGLCLSGCVFNGKLFARKTGISNDNGTGNNIFNDSLEIISEGSGYFVMSNNTVDYFNAPATFTSTSSGLIYVAHNAANTVFNDQVYVNCTGTGSIRFSTGNGSSSFAAGKKVQTGTTGFTGGTLILGAVTMPPDPFSLNVGSNAIVNIGPSAVFPGDLSIQAGGICMNGGVFSGKVNLVKNGSSSNSGIGNCVFNDSLYVTNNGTGYLVFSNATKDIYQAPVSLTTTSSGLIYMAHGGINTEFNDNLTINSTGNGGVRIGTGSGSAILASGKTISAGSVGFNSGTLILSRFTQMGTTAQTFNAGPSAYLNLGPSLVFNADVTLNAGGICLNGGTYNGRLSIVKTGSSDNAGTGNNVFNGAVSCTNSGSGYLLFSNNTRDIFNNTAEFTTTGTGMIHLAYNGVLTEFNNDLIVNSSGAGIRFGGGNGTARLADTRKIRIGATGFSAGELGLRRFTQLGNTPQVLNVNGGTANLVLSLSSTFNAPCDFMFPQMQLNGAIFNASLRAEKNGAGNNTSAGGNVFNQQTVIKASGTGNWIHAGSNPDDFNSSARFIQSGSGVLSPASNANCTFSGDISTDSSTTAIIFANQSAGNVTLDGTSVQQLTGHLLFPPTIRRLTLQNPGGGLRLNVPMTLSHMLNLTTGVIYSTSTNLLFVSSSFTTLSNASNASYVDGPVRKTGNTAFTFPLGKEGYYRPLAIAAPTASSEQYTAEYFKLNPDSLYPVNSREPALYNVSRCEYWTLQRNLGSGNVRVTLSWQNPVSCGISQVSDLRVARWDALAARWVDLGNTLTTGDVNNGTMLSNLSGAPYGVFTLGTSSAANALPVELVSFSARRAGTTAVLNWVTHSEKNNDFFTLERSADGNVFEAIGTVKGAGTTVIRTEYSYHDQAPLEGRSYYRLKQTDFNGESEIFRAILLDADKTGKSLSLLSAGPNPFNNELEVNVGSEADGSLEVMLYNVQGAVAYRKQLDVTGGSNRINLQIEGDLPPGIYFLRITSGNDSTEPLKLIRK